MQNGNWKKNDNCIAVLIIKHTSVFIQLDYGFFVQFCYLRKQFTPAANIKVCFDHLVHKQNFVSILLYLMRIPMSERRGRNYPTIRNLVYSIVTDLPIKRGLVVIESRATFFPRLPLINTSGYEAHISMSWK